MLPIDFNRPYDLISNKMNHNKYTHGMLQQPIDNNNHFPDVTINTMSRQEMIRDILENIAFVELPRVVYFRRNFVCSTCYAIYDCHDALQVHKSSHLVEFKALFNKQRLAELKAKYRRKIEYLCNECDYVCFSSGHLKKHKRKHSTETPYHCDICNFKCKAPNYLRQHKMIHTGETRYNCKECNYKCRFLKSLRLHEMKHSGIMPFSCEFCNYRCRLASDLKKHLLIHNGTKDFKCDQCLYSCLRSGDLKIHKMIHSDEKPFKCDSCEYVCRRRGDLRKHKTTHGNQNLLHCTECHYECRSPVSMKRHRVIHNDFIDPALLAESSAFLADPDSMSLATFLASSHVMQEACNNPIDEAIKDEDIGTV